MILEEMVKQLCCRSVSSAVMREALREAVKARLSLLMSTTNRFTYIQVGTDTTASPTMTTIMISIVSCSLIAILMVTTATGRSRSGRRVCLRLRRTVMSAGRLSSFATLRANEWVDGRSQDHQLGSDRALRVLWVLMRIEVVILAWKLCY